MLQSHIFECLTFDAIDDATVKWYIVHNIGHTIYCERENGSNVTIDELDVINAAAERVRNHFIQIHLQIRNNRRFILVMTN